MASAEEATGNQGSMAATLEAGVDQISARQVVTFQKYAKIVVAPDSYVFWVATGRTMDVRGSLHYSTDRHQDEDQTLASNQVILTAEEEVTEFNQSDPQYLWIGAWTLPGIELPLQVAFGQRADYFGPANLWHYSGFAVYPAMSTQIIQSAADLPDAPIVSNSLPIWLAQNSLAPVYPSFLVPDNIAPPYIVAHIEPGRTEALGAFPVVGPWPGVILPNTGSDPLHAIPSSQLCRDEVILTLYGFSNQMAIQFLQSLIDFSLDDESFGFANSPVIRDAKRGQVEIGALAMKKTIEILANYYQGTADAVARRLILEASVAYAFVGGVSPFGSANVTQAPGTVTATGTVFQI